MLKLGRVDLSSLMHLGRLSALFFKGASSCGRRGRTKDSILALEANKRVNESPTKRDTFMFFFLVRLCFTVRPGITNVKMLWKEGHNLGNIVWWTDLDNILGVNKLCLKKIIFISKKINRHIKINKWKVMTN